MAARIISHLDMDCFYCQVEHKRLNIPTSTPLAVQQWGGVIAINYAARGPPYNIKRGMKPEECKRRCPNIQLIHVEVISANDVEGSSRVVGEANENLLSSPSSSSNIGLSSPSSSVTSSSASISSLSFKYAHGRSAQETSKVSLERYRRASEKIMSIIERFCPLCERASIDEAYIDITELVDSKMKNNSIKNIEISSSIDQLTTIDGSSLSQFNSYDNRLRIAASIVYEIRTTVYNELGYTVSGGIASNKFLAKQASSSRYIHIYL
jgi:DNA polymerase eta